MSGPWPRAGWPPNLLADAALLATLWAAAVLFVDPRGDFPLGDDWSYARTARVFLESGAFRPIGWTSMPLLSHVLWGSAFAALLGFSFEALRLSTLLLGLIGSVALVVLLREAGVARSAALLAAATLVANPVHLALANTYMTDVPFFAWCLLALACLSRTLATGSTRALALGSAFAMVAVLGRQLGLFVAVAFALCILVRVRRTRTSLARALAVLVPVIVAPLALFAWLEARDAVPALSNDQLLRLGRGLTDTGRLGFTLMKGVIRCLLYLGLFCAPVLALAGLPRPRSRAGRALAVGAAMLFAATAVFELYRIGRWMPLGSEGDSILNRSGIGPLTLRDTYILGLPQDGGPGIAFSWVVTALALSFGSLLTAHLVGVAVDVMHELRTGEVGIDESSSARLTDRGGAAPHPPGSGARLLLAVGALVYFVPLAVHGFVDRYLLPLVALVSALVLLPAPGGARRAGRAAHGLALVLLAAFFAFSTSAVHDYFSWNRARWEALDYLMGPVGAPPTQIDGGFEFNGWHLYSPDYEADELRSWWWVDDDRYVVAMGDIPGYRRLREFAHPRRLGGSRILALERHHSPSSASSVKSSAPAVAEPRSSGRSLRPEASPPR